MKKGFSVAATLLLVAVAIYFFLNSGKITPPSDESSKQNSIASPSENPLLLQNNSSIATSVLSTNVNPGSMLAPSANVAAKAGAVTPLPAKAAEISPDLVLENVSRAIRQYGEMFGGNPVGTNPEITAALNGDNAKHVIFIKPEAGMHINENGELVDIWGTPFFFHQLSGMEMEIHSAGPDRTMWTSDDLVTKQANFF